jgi:hypothetical protein
VGQRRPDAERPGQECLGVCGQRTGSEWLGLTNGVNSGSSSRYQSLGIERSIDTLNGATYSLSLDYAGALGLAAANTRIGVYVDGVQVGSYASVSSNSALNWEALSFTFQGNGKPRNLRIQLEAGTDISTAKGTMVDAIKVVETMPSSTGVAYGFVNGAVALPAIGARLANGDTDATVKTELVGLAKGSMLSDGVRSITIASGAGAVDVSGWNLAALVLRPPANFVGAIQLQVRATSTELGNGSSATISRDFTVQVLSGAACTTPASLNPFISFANDTSAVTAAQAEVVVVASALTAVAIATSIIAPDLLSIAGGSSGSSESDESMEDWLRRMSQNLGSAFESQIGALFTSGR